MGRHTLAISLALATPALAEPTLHNLGVLPGGFSSVGTAISDDGTVAGGHSYPLGFDNIACRWTAATGLQAHGPQPSGSTNVFGMDSAGSVLVGQRTFGFGSSRAIRWIVGLPLQDLATEVGDNSAIARDTSADGSITVGDSGPIGSERAALWKAAGAIRILGTPTGTGRSTARAVSADGSIVIGDAGITLPGRAFRWSEATGFVDLGTLPNASVASARAISADASVIAGWSGTATLGRPCRWTAAGIDELALPASADAAYTAAISADGRVIAGYASINGTRRAVRWMTNQPPQDLNTLAQSLGIDLTGWTLEDARALSANGSAVVGTGRFNGAERAFLLSGLPVTTPCPANCDGSTAAPILTPADFTCFLAKYRAGDASADCDSSGTFSPADFTCFLARYRGGCP